MKKLSLLILSLLVYSVGRSQNPVVDTHAASQIFAIDYASGQEVQAAGDQAILFKDAFIDLVSNTQQSRQILRMTPGRKMAIIKQIDPQQRINGYQLTWQSIMFGHAQPVCTFYYNIDDNSLYFFSPNDNDWRMVEVKGPNMENLERCRNYANFNANTQGGVPDLSANGQQNAPDMSANGGTQDQATADMQAGLDTLSDEDIQASVAPPEMPEYEQPECPVEGYLWQPGYWGWNIAASDYYWVPGVWVAPPRPGLLWTPGYWGFVGGIYRFHHGYWGASVGFYGGVHYGCGYFGVGFVGGGWRGGVFRYNTAVVHVNRVVVRNVYVDNTVIRNTTVINRVSYNGGPRGIVARPTAVEISASRETHYRATNYQVAHREAAVNDKAQFASVNKGRPTVITMTRVTATPPANNRNNFNRPNNGNNVNQPRPNNNDNFNRPNNEGNADQPRPNNPNFNRPNNDNNANQPRPNNPNFNRPNNDNNANQPKPNNPNFNRPNNGNNANQPRPSDLSAPNKGSNPNPPRPNNFNQPRQNNNPNQPNRGGGRSNNREQKQPRESRPPKQDRGKKTTDQ